jgi:hypothetical protein
MPMSVVASSALILRVYLKDGCLTACGIKDWSIKGKCHSFML